MVPFLSVIIPTFNRARSIERAVGSVLDQQGADFELIVVDDGSTDDTPEVVKQIKDDRLIYLRQGNSGRCSARNLGARSSRGVVVTFLDSDDEALPDWLNNFTRMFEHPKVGVACCGYLDAILRHDTLRETLILPRNLGPMYHHQKSLFHPPGTFAIRRELFESIGGYKEEIAFSENTELAMRLVPYCESNGWKIESLAKPGIRYYRHPARHAKTERDFKELLQAAEVILTHHGEELRKKFPRGYANYCGIAGVNAARLKQFHHARQFFVSAITQYPRGFSNYARLLVCLLPSIATKLWLRQNV
jgi:glycosyltransferase involved in cell wall biosynthesis